MSMTKLVEFLPCSTALLDGFRERICQTIEAGRNRRARAAYCARGARIECSARLSTNENSQRTTPIARQQATRNRSCANPWSHSGDVPTCPKTITRKFRAPIGSACTNVSTRTTTPKAKIARADQPAADSLETSRWSRVKRVPLLRRLSPRESDRILSTRGTRPATTIKSWRAVGPRHRRP